MVSMPLSTNLTSRQARVTDSSGSRPCAVVCSWLELVRLDDGVDLVHLGGLVQVLVDVEKERGVDVRLPGHEPVGRERQLALARRPAGHFLVQAQQPLVGKIGLRFENLQPGAELDQRDGAADLPGFR